MARPSPQEYGEYYHRYISLVPENDIASAFTSQTAVVLEFLDHLPEKKLNYAYAPGKWTIKQVLQHIIDAERIFAYRALRFARLDETPLPGFEENDYAEVANVEHRKWTDMIEEFQMVRSASEHLFLSLDEDELLRSGTASNTRMSVRSLGYVIIGHSLHHMRIVKERYL